MAMRLGAVAASTHRAPAAVAALAVVEEEPLAFRIGAMAHPREPLADQQVAGRPQHRRQQPHRAGRAGDDTPAEAMGERLDRVRRCANDVCLWLFLDDSKSGNRRWCSMSACGNRAKAHRHYARKKAAER